MGPLEIVTIAKLFKAFSTVLVIVPDGALGQDLQCKSAMETLLFALSWIPSNEQFPREAFECKFDAPEFWPD